jgi:hypothetical protein
MRRVPLLDGLRGYFLLFMLLTHLFGGAYPLVRVNHAELGFVQDAQGFVFISGLLVGVLYGRRMERFGFAGPARQIWRRAVELYLWMIGLMLAVLVLRAALPGAAAIWDEWLGLLPSGTTPVRLTAAAMLYQPTFFDILPQYILYLAAAPLLLRLCMTGRPVAVLTGSVLLWLAVQLGIHLGLADGINSLLGRWQTGLTLRVAFNPLAWQVLFFSAMALGVMWTQGRLDVRRLLDPARPGPAMIAGIVVAFFALWRLGFTFELVPKVMMLRFWIFENRTEFSLVFLVNFIALAYLIAWVLVAGAASAARTVRAASTFLNSLFTLPFLCLMGRHSLQVYAWHVLVVYLAAWFDGYFGPYGGVGRSFIALVCIVLLPLPAVFIEWRARRRMRRDAVAVAAE